MAAYRLTYRLVAAPGYFFGCKRHIVTIVFNHAILTPLFSNAIVNSPPDVSAKLSIIKTCTKNVSCDLQVNATRDVMPCDQSLGSWVCTTCCQDDMCNLSNAPAQPLPNMEVIVAGVLMSFILQFCLGDHHRSHRKTVRRHLYYSPTGNDNQRQLEYFK